MEGRIEMDRGRMSAKDGVVTEGSECGICRSHYKRLL